MVLHNESPNISFGIIVLNGEPFTKYCLRQLYPFAHEIIIVEGASQYAKDVADENGHSLDGTLEALYEFKEQEDSEDRVQIITRDGFWSEKDEQSQAYANQATGDYLWQVDIDEFYRPEDIRKVMQLLTSRPEVTAMSFNTLTFFGSFNAIVGNGDLWKHGTFRRLFKWGPGYQYTAHRPPTVCDPDGNDLFNIKPVLGPKLARKGIFLYHFAYVLPKQVENKTDYYARMGFWTKEQYEEWFNNTWDEIRTPMRIIPYHRGKSWVSRFHGTLPAEIERLQQDISSGKIHIELRRVDDIERLLSSHRYSIMKGLAFISECMRVHVWSLFRPRGMLSYAKKCVKAVFRYLGLEIRKFREQPEQPKQVDWMGLQGEGNKWLKKFDIRSVFDIGANTGAFTWMITRIFPDAMIYAFEPLADCFDAMNTSMRHHKKFKSFNVALGDAEMETNIYRSESSLSSSCLEMEDLHKVNAPHTAAASLEKIKVKRLDDVIKDLKIEDNILIKIDTQGYEDRVILGGLNLIRRAKVIIIETSFHELYKDQPLFDVIYDLLKKQGFSYMGSLEEWRSPIDGSILQEDSLFIREPWDSFENIGR